MKEVLILKSMLIRKLRIGFITFILFHGSFFFSQEIKLKNYIEEFNEEVKKYSIENSKLQATQRNYILQLIEGQIPSGCSVEPPQIGETGKIVIKSKDFSVLICFQKFDSLHHTFDLRNDSCFFVDRKVKFGCRYSLPKYELKSMKCNVKRREVEVQDSIFRNLYNPNFICEKVENIKTDLCSAKLISCPDRKYKFLVFSGGDGGTYYQVYLVFFNGRYVNKVIYVP